MKRCPKCSRVYADDSLNFCLDDGEWLLTDDKAAEASTVIISGSESDPGQSTQTLPGGGESTIIQKPVGKQKRQYSESCGCGHSTPHCTECTSSAGSRALDYVRARDTSLDVIVTGAAGGQQTFKRRFRSFSIDLSNRNIARVASRISRA
jgi:hypothetical protein